MHLESIPRSIEPGVGCRASSTGRKIIETVILALSAFAINWPTAFSARRIDRVCKSRAASSRGRARFNFDAYFNIAIKTFSYSRSAVFSSANDVPRSILTSRVPSRARMIAANSFRTRRLRREAWAAIFNDARYQKERKKRDVSRSRDFPLAVIRSEVTSCRTSGGE